MRRYDTFTPKATTAFIYTLEVAEALGHTNFICEALKYSLHCKECPFYGEHLYNSCWDQYKTAPEWLAWAGQEIEEDN